MREIDLDVSVGWVIDMGLAAVLAFLWFEIQSSEPLVAIGILTIGMYYLGNMFLEILNSARQSENPLA